MKSDIEKAIEKLRSQKNVKGTPAHMIYSLLQTAHPTVREVIEIQAAEFFIAGEKIGNVLREASKTDEGRKEIQKRISELMSKGPTHTHEGSKEED